MREVSRGIVNQGSKVHYHINMVLMQNGMLAP
jgi:hypothetical protein